MLEESTGSCLQIEIAKVSSFLEHLVSYLRFALFFVRISRDVLESMYFSYCQNRMS